MVQAYLCVVFATLLCAVGKVHKRNTLEQLKLVGPNTLSVALLTAAFVGMVFTIQVCRMTFFQHSNYLSK